MPHQCVSCGETFDDGSEDLLEGCPSCEGTQFFFTEDPLDAEEREELKDETESSAQEMLEDLVDEADQDLDGDLFSRDAWEDWIQADDEASAKELAEELVEETEDDVAFEPLTPEEEMTDLRESEAVQVSLEDVQEAEPPQVEREEGEPAEIETVDEAATLEATTDGEARKRPSTLNIEQPGQYEIDVERLMEDSPVIVERDGSFVIHLPSVFDGDDS